MHGQGVYTWNDGRKYEGSYHNDKKHGFGVYKWIDGRIYEGMWMDGKQHGKGKYILPDDSFKIGKWDNGKRVEWFEDNTEIDFVQEIEDLNALTKKKDVNKNQMTLE